MDSINRFLRSLNYDLIKRLQSYYLVMSVSRRHYNRKRRSQIIRDVPNCIKRGLGRENFPPALELLKESLSLQDLLVIFRTGSYSSAILTALVTTDFTPGIFRIA